MSSSNQNSQINNTNIQQWLQTGFETIVQAFDINSTTFQLKLKEKGDMIKEWREKIKLLEEENGILKEENSFYKSENEELRQNNILLSKKNKDNESKLKRWKSGSNSHIIPNKLDSWWNRHNGNNANNMNEHKENKNSYNRGYHNTNASANINVNNQFYTHIHGKSSNHNAEKKHQPKWEEISTNSKTGIETRVDCLMKNWTSRNESYTNLFNQKKKTIDDSFNYEDKKNFFQQTNSLLNGNKTDRVYKRITPEDEDEYNHNNSNDKYNEDINEFWNKCKIYLSPLNFEKIAEILDSFKEGKINEEEVISYAKRILQNNKNLLNWFENIFLS